MSDLNPNWKIEPIDPGEEPPVVLVWIDGDGVVHPGSGINEATAFGVVWRAWNETHLETYVKARA